MLPSLCQCLEVVTATFGQLCTLLQLVTHRVTDTENWTSVNEDTKKTSPKIAKVQLANGLRESVVVKCSTRKRNRKRNKGGRNRRAQYVEEQLSNGIKGSMTGNPIEGKHNRQGEDAEALLSCGVMEAQPSNQSKRRRYRQNTVSGSATVQRSVWKHN